MNRPAILIPSRQPSVAPSMLLDLTVKPDRDLHSVIERTHGGDDPMWRALAMYRIGDKVYELAEWMRDGSHGQERRYSVIEWLSNAEWLGMRWGRRKLTLRGAQRVYQRRQREASLADGLCVARGRLSLGGQDRHLLTEQIDQPHTQATGYPHESDQSHVEFADFQPLEVLQVDVDRVGGLVQRPAPGLAQGADSGAQRLSLARELVG